MITLQKISKWQHDVCLDGKKIGELIKEYHKGTGRASVGAVGHIKGYYQYAYWADNDNDTDGAVLTFDSVKEAKVGIGKIYGK